jgi:hypothetical protein
MPSFQRALEFFRQLELPGTRRRAGSPTSHSYLALMVTVTELLLVLVSVPLKATDAVFEIVPAEGTVTFTVTIMFVPLARVAEVQVIVPPAEPMAGPTHVPLLSLAPWKIRVGGKLSVNTTLLAVGFPLFLIWNV